MMYTPRFQVTLETASNLMRIQQSASLVDQVPLPASILQLMQKESKESTVILSTKIEGNRLDDRQKRQAIKVKGGGAEQQEVHNLMKALEFIEQAEERKLPITEDLIKQLHAIIRVIPHGRRPHLSEYRKEQNQVGQRNEEGYYLPPEPGDVPRLMEDLVAWINLPLTLAVPSPIRAGIFMHQFLTIHPYMDGNGRTARMLATYILRRDGLSLKRLFVLESYYDRHLDGYYRNLQLGLSHNYYFGRNAADISAWVDFFVKGLAEVFQSAALVVTEKSRQYMAVEPEPLRRLDPIERTVFAQLALKVNWASTTDLRNWTTLADRTVRDKVRHWIDIGFLVPRDESARRIRSVMLSPEYEQVAEQVRAEPERYRYFLQ